MEEHDNTDELHNEEETPKKKSNLAAIIVLIICLVLSLGANVFLFLQLGETDTLIAQNTELNNVKDTLQQQVNELQDEINAFKAKVGRMSEESESFDLERSEYLAQIADLEDRLSRAQAAIYNGDAAQLARAKQELAKVKSEKELLGQRLEEAKDKIKIEEEKNATYLESLEAAGRQADSLIKAKENLEKKVSKASDVKLKNTIAVPTRDKRGTDIEEPRAHKVEKIALELVTLENVLAEKGEKDLFIIITGPGGIVLTNNNSDLTDKSKLYSIKKTIDYDGTEMSINFTFKQKAEYKPGSYSVRVIIDGSLAGRTEFKLR